MAFEKPLFRLGDMPYTAVDVLLLPALLAALWIGVGALTNLVRSRAARVLGRSSGASETAALLARYAFTFLGAIVIFQAWGIDLASFAIFASVVGVGIGFGLQNIASNFISGVLIGLERPIAPGDFVDVGEHRGTVQKIGARSTSILTLDRVTILVPNAHFLEREVINWSHGDPVSRLHVAVVGRLWLRHRLVRAACSRPRIAPRRCSAIRAACELTGWRGRLDFELLVYTADPKSRNRIASDLRYRLEQGLRAHGIEIPFPQTDVNLPPELMRAALAFARRARLRARLARALGGVRRRERPARMDPRGARGAGRADARGRRRGAGRPALAAGELSALLRGPRGRRLDGAQRGPGPARRARGRASAGAQGARAPRARRARLRGREPLLPLRGGRVRGRRGIIGVCCAS
jgi:small-conductance mechanosensitive channel